MLFGAPPSDVSAPRDWYQRGVVRYSSRSSTASCSRRTNRRSLASWANRSADTSPSARTGSPPKGCHRAGSRVSNRSRVSGCQDHRRFMTNWDRGVSGSGRAARTVNRRRARTDREYPADGIPEGVPADLPPRSAAGLVPPPRRVRQLWGVIAAEVLVGPDLDSVFSDDWPP